MGDPFHGRVALESSWLFLIVLVLNCVCWRVVSLRPATGSSLAGRFGLTDLCGPSEMETLPNRNPLIALRGWADLEVTGELNGNIAR